MNFISSRSLKKTSAHSSESALQKLTVGLRNIISVSLRGIQNTQIHCAGKKGSSLKLLQSGHIFTERFELLNITDAFQGFGTPR